MLEDSPGPAAAGKTCRGIQCVQNGVHLFTGKGVVGTGTPSPESLMFSMDQKVERFKTDRRTAFGTQLRTGRAVAGNAGSWDAGLDWAPAHRQEDAWLCW